MGNFIESELDRRLTGIPHFSPSEREAMREIIGHRFRRGLEGPAGTHPTPDRLRVSPGSGHSPEAADHLGFVLHADPIMVPIVSMIVDAQEISTERPRRAILFTTKWSEREWYEGQGRHWEIVGRTGAVQWKIVHVTQDPVDPDVLRATKIRQSQPAAATPHNWFMIPNGRAGAASLSGITADARAIAAAGFTHVLSLHQDPTVQTAVEAAGMAWMGVLAITDWKAATPEQRSVFYGMLDELPANARLMIHCSAGQGRSPMMVAIAMLHGTDCTAAQAMEAIQDGAESYRHLDRDKVPETDPQREAIAAAERELRARRNLAGASL